jgi:hypothetical protein
MLKFCKTIIFFTLIAIIFGCAQPKSIALKASPLADQTLRFEQGHQVFISPGVQYSLALAWPTEIIKPGNPIDFFVYIQNNSIILLIFLQRISMHNVGRKISIFITRRRHYRMKRKEPTYLPQV